MSDPPDPTGNSLDGPGTVLVRTPVVDPTAALDAASVEEGVSVIAVLASVSRERFERRLAEGGYDLASGQSVEFTPNVDPADAATPSDGEWRHGDIAGLSMDLVRKLDGLAEERGVVYVDSVAPFVAAAGLESAFRFFVIVAARARAASVPLVARLDPEAVDSVAAETLVEAFDRTVEGPLGEPPDGRDGDG